MGLCGSHPNNGLKNSSDDQRRKNRRMNNNGRGGPRPTRCSFRRTTTDCAAISRADAGCRDKSWRSRTPLRGRCRRLRQGPNERRKSVSLSPQRGEGEAGAPPRGQFRHQDGADQQWNEQTEDNDLPAHPGAFQVEKRAPRTERATEMEHTCPETNDGQRESHEKYRQ